MEQYQSLFNYLSNELGAIATHTQLAEIAQICEQASKPRKVENFMQDILPQLNQRGIIVYYDGDKSRFSIRDRGGLIYTFHPKDNVIFHPEQKKWLDDGTEFLKKEFLQ